MSVRDRVNHSFSDVTTLGARQRVGHFAANPNDLTSTMISPRERAAFARDLETVLREKGSAPRQPKPWIAAACVLAGAIWGVAIWAAVRLLAQ